MSQRNNKCLVLPRCAPNQSSYPNRLVLVEGLEQRIIPIRLCIHPELIAVYVDREWSGGTVDLERTVGDSIRPLPHRHR